MPHIEIEQIEVARDAWQEDEGASERWREMLKEHPVPVQNYIGKRFKTELDLGIDQRFRITQITYARNPEGQYEITDNTPGF